MTRIRLRCLRYGPTVLFYGKEKVINVNHRKEDAARKGKSLRNIIDSETRLKMSAKLYSIIDAKPGKGNDVKVKVY